MIATLLCVFGAARLTINPYPDITIIIKDRIDFYK